MLYIVFLNLNLLFNFKTMRYSKLFGKTEKEGRKEISLKSHKLLFQAGFVRESTAGRYYFLPLGWRVHQKIRDIIKQEMDKAGAQEMVAPILQPLNLWKETNRNESGGYELTIVKDRRGDEFTLGGTGEEMFVDVVRNFQLSYKDLPLNIYQFGSKFRDELRSKGGLLRTREFVMKDGYSFHTSPEDFEKEYNNMSKAYKNIYDRVGLLTDIVPADNGYFGGDYCHEFIVESDAGESTYFITEDGSYIAHQDIAKFDRGEMNPDEEMAEFKSIDQPDWVRTMEDNLKHYNQPKWRFLKNVVYKNRETNEIIIATIRGDLEVNSNKLEHALGMVGLLDDATDEDLASIGTKSGYVHAWGHKGCRYVGDLSLKSVKNFIGGQKEELTDTFNVNYGKDFEHDITADIAKAQDGFLTENTKLKLVQKKGVEVGNIFQLAQHYSTKMNAVVNGEDGLPIHYYMGCYGIGLGRTMATVAEIFSDERGLIWPESIAPFKIHLIGLNLEDEAIKLKADELYNQLISQNIEVLYDDRIEIRPGEKFADADLIGNPWRVVISRKSIENGGVEVKKRNETESKVVTIEELQNQVK